MKLSGVVIPERPGCVKEPVPPLEEEERADLILHGRAVEAISSIMRRGEEGIKEFPGCLKGFLRKGSWRSRIIPSRPDELVKFNSFEQFVTAFPLEGLGATVRQLEALCRDDAEALVLIDAALQRGRGNPTGANQHTDPTQVETEAKRGILDNIQDSSRRAEAPTGTSTARSLRKLRTEAEKPDAPDEVKRTYQQVLAGEISPHRGMINAGFRRVPSRFEIAVKAVLRLQQDERQRLMQWMENGCPETA